MLCTTCGMSPVGVICGPGIRLRAFVETPERKPFKRSQFGELFLDLFYPLADDL